MRVSGINIPKEKRVVIALTYVYGIGDTTARKILDSSGINADTRVKNLTQQEQDKLREIVEKTFRVEGDLRREVGASIKRLKDIKSYRGSRHARHLPARGQRTKTNSRTVRGNKRNLAPSGKKKSAAKT